MPLTPPSGAVSAGTPAMKTPGRLIVVFGTKGGVGKTMVATNLAVALAQRLRKPIALMDLDITAVGDVAKVLNLTIPRSVADLAPALQRGPSSEPVSLDGMLVPHATKVHVAACFSNPRQLAQLNPKALPRVFQALKQRYEYVIIDGGRTFSDYLIEAFDASNMIIFVASPDVVTLYQTKWALDVVESLLFPSSMVKVILNRAESRGGVGTQDVRAAIPCEVIGEIPSDGRIVGTAMNQGVPIVTAFERTGVAQAFVHLAEVLTTQPNLYVSHQDIPRHRTPGSSPALNTQSPDHKGGTWTNRLYGANGDDNGMDDALDEIALMKRRIHERLVEELDLKKLDLAVMANNTKMDELRQKTERVIANLLAKEMGGVASSHEVRARLVKEIADEALGLGPLEELLDDPEVSDILVNNKDQIYVERRGKLELTTKKFVTNDQVRAVIERIIAPLGRRIDESTPMVDARLPDGSRINAVIPPLAIKGPSLSIRKFSRIRYTQDDLIKFDSLSPTMAQFIRGCVLARKNLIISGGTGSGKTTFLNIVSAFIPEAERILTIEDAAELRLAQTHLVSLEARPPSVEGKGQVSIRDLFRNALRMRPDRIIIGECRGAETLDMLQAMNTGHDGSMTTVHANSPRDVISRLDSMVLMSNIDLPVRAIREMVASAIDVIVHTARMSDGSRKVTAITELLGLGSDGEIQFQDLFAFKQTGVAPDGKVLGQFEATGKIPTFIEELRVKGITFDADVFQNAPAGNG